MTVCSRCVMDTTDSNITFNEHGECCYCTSYDNLPKLNYSDFERLVQQIKHEGEGKPYDCLLGLSGGPDSSYLAMLLKKHTNLQVLLIHVANGYDTPNSHINVELIRQYTGYDIEHVILDHAEFNDLTLAFLKASVVDADIPADHAIVAVQWKTAIKHHVYTLLTGYNHSCEYYMPRAWTYSNKNDLTNLRNIHKRFGKIPLRTFPTLSAWQKIFYRNLYGIKYANPLNCFPYSKLEAIKQLSKIGWQLDGHKHSENHYTRFYQNYILPMKFGIDKRKSHFSSLIRSSQITRQQALQELGKKPYEPTDIYGVSTGSETQFQEDKTFILSHLGISEAEFSHIMSLPIIPHELYGTDQWIYSLCNSPRKIWRKLK